ncbi:28S ribosomal protein S10, mitochondrial [Diaphorina citri]|uniref:Small ribosomal subunit protein uS10m n=1 Tax=Diaphorina citri TaxID=121845 RepID=A0A1S3D0E1_DIACI|nr:28S ribosomal protein S10, mitochondrial [Diaphorina citri]
MPVWLGANGSRRLLNGSTSTANIRHSSSVISQEKEPVPDKLYSRICCELRANDPEVMNSYSKFATAAAQHLNIEIGECYAQKKAHHERYTLLRSVHVVKRCRVQYEVRTYFRWMNFHKLTGSTADTFLEYIQRNLPEGVALKVTKYELQKLPSHFVPPTLLESGSPETSVEDAK